jgi:Transposase DDE domain
MQHKSVQQVLQAHFKLDARRVEFIARFILALLQVRNVQLSQIATALNGNAKLESNLKRAERFLKFDLAQRLIARFVLNFVPEGQLVLVMDRTHWKFGHIDLNLLVIAIAHHGTALPIAWVNLEKAGNSNASERRSLLERVLTLVPAGRIQGFAADREFIGEAWFVTLLECGVNPVIRIKRDTMIQHRSKKAPAHVWFHTLERNQIQELGKARVMGIRVFVLATLTLEGELLVLVTSKRPSKALVIYARRWEIECLFSALKTRGFNLEDSHVTDAARSERLFGLLVLALVWAVRVGEWVTRWRPIPIRHHGSPLLSVFRTGLDGLRQILLSGCSDGFVLDDLIPLLSGS